MADGVQIYNLVVTQPRIVAHCTHMWRVGVLRLCRMLRNCWICMLMHYEPRNYTGTTSPVIKLQLAMRRNW